MAVPFNAGMPLVEATPTPPGHANAATPGTPDRRLGLPPMAWAAAVLLAGLLCTAFVAHREWDDLQDRAEEHRSALADAGIARLRVPLEQAASMLRAMQTVFLSNDQMDQARFSQYHASLRSPLQPGSYTSIAFARREPAGQPLADHVSYRYAYVAPYEANTTLIGFDMVTQKANLSALLQARDTDAVVVSAPFALRQTTPAGHNPLGVTLRLPVYSHGPTPTTPNQRRTRELGALAIGIRLEPMVESALAGPVLDGFRVRISDATADPHPFYDAGTEVEAGLAMQVRRLDFGGRQWRVELLPRPQPLDLGRLQAILVGGGVISLLLSALVWSLTTTRRRAVALGAQMSARYRESELRFRTLNELLPALVLLAHARDGRIVYANQAARLRLGDPTGLPLSALFSDPQLQHRARDADAIGTDWGNLEAVLLSPGGDAFWASASISQVDMEGQAHLLMVATDISEQRELTERLSYQATHDALTELCNRREFERRVEEALHERKGRVQTDPCALLYIDLDQFKLINDVSGHMAGDQLLAQLALAMRHQLRGGDVLARLGGDEFGLMAFHVDAEGAHALAERLRECIEALMFVWQDRTYTVSASIGVVVVDQQEPTLKDLLAWADTACYLAKENGRNRVHVYRQDNETTRRQGEMEWASRLRWAVEQDRLLLDYQEIVPLDGSDTATSIELLLRLRDEDGGVVLPGAFLPAAERYGLMPAIDRWVIRNALAHFAQLHHSGMRLGTCAINLSGASIEDDGLADFILARITEYAVPAHTLCFEITETVAVRNLLKVVNVIERLRRAGCRIALDDFGAGMSSFGYLKNLPVDLIKIDGSFIRDLETEPMSRTIVSAIAQIGHQRGLKVVAEWVSSPQLCESLRSLGVDYGQGFALHRPERVLYQRDEHPPRRLSVVR